MQLGTFKVPDMRLGIVVSETLKKIYESVKTDEIQSKDLSQLLGYKFGTEVTLFKKINSMLAYGILEGSRGVYKITKLGEDLLFPEPEKEQQLKTQAIMNVELWKALFEKNKKDLPKNGLWVQLKNLAGVDPATAKKYENRISNWYTEDMESLPDDFVLDDVDTEQMEQSEPIRSSTTDNNSRLRTDVETISFDKYEVTLPKGDLSKEWKKLKKYMDIKLEDYKYEEPINEKKSSETKTTIKSPKPLISSHTEKPIEE